MKYSPKQYAYALYLAVSESHPKDQERILDNFVALLRENGDFSKIDEIEKEYLEYDRQTRGVKLAELSTARQISQAEESEIIQELNAYVGGQVELKKKVDEGLLGGVVVKIGDERIDGSIAGNLKDLKNKLMESSI